MGGALFVLAAATVGFLSDEPRPAVVQVGAGPDQSIVTGPEGTPLYTYAGDGVSRDCLDACLAAWPALLAKPDDKAVGDWSPQPRPGGALQWTYKNRFVHYFASDTGSADATGDGLGGRWTALRYVGPTPRVEVPPGAKVFKVKKEFLITDLQGRALYTFARDGRAPACRAECLEIWLPLDAPALARPVGEWSIVDRPDGIRQWAWQGKLLYRFHEDVEAGDAKGAGIGGVWQTVVAKPDKSAEIAGREQ